MKTRSFSAFASLALAGVLLNSCSKSASSGGTLSLSDLSQLPDASGMVKANSAARFSNLSEHSLFNSLNIQNNFSSNLSLRPTPPTVSGIADNYSYFWPSSLVTDINENWATSDNTAKNNYRNLFWGKDYSTPGPGGNGACQMAMSSAEALGKVLEGSGTMCYMKAVPTLASGITVSSGSAADLFKQTATDKKVQVNVLNMPQRPSFTVNFTIKGSNTVGSDVYAYNVHFCQAGVANQSESTTVNKASGLVTMSSDRKETTDSYGSNTVTAHLKNDGSNVSYDLSQERTAVSYGSYSSQDYRGKVVIKGDNTITNYRLNSGPGYSNKDFSVASFLGSSMTSLQFLEGAYKGVGQWNTNTFAYSGATAYQTVAAGNYQGTYYVALDPANSELAQSASFTSVDVAADAFFSGTSPQAPSYDSTALCSAWTPDISVTMDFADPAVLAVQTACESGKDWQAINFYLCQGQKLVETTTPHHYTVEDITVLKNAFNNVQNWN